LLSAVFVFLYWLAAYSLQLAAVFVFLYLLLAFGLKFSAVFVFLYWLAAYSLQLYLYLLSALGLQLSAAISRANLPMFQCCSLIKTIFSLLLNLLPTTGNVFLIPWLLFPVLTLKPVRA
jgi:hypothetical protein